MSATPWAISGTYLESCNCEAICPCRRIDGRQGGRSTHGECMGALSWFVTDGHLGEVDLAGFGAVLLIRYSDDEPGSPWTFVVFVDERGDERQREALAAILTVSWAVRRSSSFRGSSSRVSCGTSVPPASRSITRPARVGFAPATRCSCG